MPGRGPVRVVVAGARRGCGGSCGAAGIFGEGNAGPVAGSWRLPGRLWGVGWRPARPESSRRLSGALRASRPALRSSQRLSKPLSRPGGPGRQPPPERPSTAPSLADDLHTRALALRAASEGDLSIREAVDLAAVQLGLEAPALTEGEDQ